MYIVQSATTPVFISGCGTYLFIKVSKMRLYHTFSLNVHLCIYFFVTVQSQAKFHKTDVKCLHF